MEVLFIYWSMEDEPMYLLEYMPRIFREKIGMQGIDLSNIREIRIRTGKPIFILGENREFPLENEDGSNFIATDRLCDSVFHAINDYSLYAHSDSIRKGFITIRGGHRIGFAGQAVMEEGKIKTICNISSLNIRISHEVRGVSDGVLEALYDENNSIKNTLIISPPGFGKTTMLRDIVRNISNGTEGKSGVNVTVIDERSEIAACYKGIPENDLGDRCDVFDGVAKAEGMMLALRTMSPKVIAVDEIGGEDDVAAIRQVSKCGCGIIATAHGGSKEDLCINKAINSLIKDKLFQNYIVIRKDGTSYVCS